MPGLNLKAAQWEQQHKTHVEEYLRQIEALYDVASDELIRLGMGYKYQPNTGRLFAFSSNKSRSKQADASLSSFRNKLSTIITAGITSEWFFANDKNDSWVKQLFDNPKKGWMLHNLGALEAFQRRTTYGHNLSERVWSIAKQFERHIELSLSIGISEGRSAADISRDVRVYLNEPDKLFRRVRNAFGNLTLSKVAQAYHPGQGVYRSSYQNAMRMARTEINSAYREADSIRWQHIARESMLVSFVEYFQQKFGKCPLLKSINYIAYIISWNVWQMDGLRGVIPNSCGERREVVADLFGTTEVVTQCEGCLKDDIRRHNGVYCQIKDWHATDKATGKKGKRIRFIDLIK